ncbi:hypothetical protein Q3G72_024585 [Acer saccharum]|nr:hypothetical protein Q3G72_024585 [Acer saccharum]
MGGGRIPYPDNRDNAKLREFCEVRGINLRFASVAHPQTNGLVEATNKTIKKLLKKTLQWKKGKWAEELLNVQHFEPESYEAKLRASLDLLEEKQDKATERVAAYQSKIARYFNKRVKT